MRFKPGALGGFVGFVLSDCRLDFVARSSTLRFQSQVMILLGGASRTVQAGFTAIYSDRKTVLQQCKIASTMLHCIYLLLLFADFFPSRNRRLVDNKHYGMPESVRLMSRPGISPRGGDGGISSPWVRTA